MLADCMVDLLCLMVAHTNGQLKEMIISDLNKAE